MRTAATIAYRMIPTLWLGMVAAISLLETPLKFRAPEITMERGLGIGRLVFHALNRVELLLAGLLIFAVIMLGASLISRLWLGALGVATAALLAQVLLVRPVLDDRLTQIVAGEPVPDSHFHLVYIALEGAKLLALATMAITSARDALPLRQGTPAPSGSTAELLSTSS